MTLMGSSQNRVGPIISSRMIAALLTRMSSLPCSARTRSNSAFVCSSSAWSTWAAMPSPPAAVTSSAVSPIVPAERRLAGLLRPPGDIHGAPMAAERVGDAQSGAAAGPGYDGDRLVGQSPTALFPLAQMRALVAERGVVAVAGVDHRRVVVDVEHPARHVAEKFLEVAFLPRLSDAAREQQGSIVGNISGDREGGPCLAVENSTSGTLRAAIYARISEDPRGLENGVSQAVGGLQKARC